MKYGCFAELFLNSLELVRQVYDTHLFTLKIISTSQEEVTNYESPINWFSPRIIDEIMAINSRQYVPLIQ